MPLNTSVVFAVRTTLCSTALRDETPIPSTFWQPTSPPQLSSLNSTSDLSPAHKFQDTLSHTGASSLVSLNDNTQSSNDSAVIRHILASRSDSPNAFGSKIPVYTALKINRWEDLLLDYHDKIVVDVLKYCWPINYRASQSPHSTMCNHPSALAFPDHVRHYIQTELSFGAIAAPFSTNPLHNPSVCSPLQTVPKRGSSKRRVVLDLSFPPTFSVNSGIPWNTYLDSPFKLRLPGIDRLCEFILAKGRDCCVYKKDRQRVYRQFPIDPKDYYLLGFTFYFDTRCPFGLRTSAMFCQRTTMSVIYIFKQAGFSADIYLDDFYGDECPSLADNAFATLQSILDTLGLASSPEKDSRRPLRWFAWVSSSIPRILHNVFQSRGFVNYPMSYICGCHASALPSKNCSLCSVNFLSCLLASTLVGFFFLASWTLCVVSLPTLNLN